jgi:hypothetical protein
MLCLRLAKAPGENVVPDQALVFPGVILYEDTSSPNADRTCWRPSAPRALADDVRKAGHCGGLSAWLSIRLAAPTVACY